MRVLHVYVCVCCNAAGHGLEERREATLPARKAEVTLRQCLSHYSSRPPKKNVWQRLHVNRHVIAAKIEQELNWTPNETFETGIYKTVEWYLENK